MFSRSSRTSTSEDKRSHPFKRAWSNPLLFFSSTSTGTKPLSTSRSAPCGHPFLLTTESTCTHDNPTDTQHHSAHTYEVGFGSATPLRNPQILRGLHWVIRSNYLLSPYPSLPPSPPLTPPPPHGYEPNMPSRSVLRVILLSHAAKRGDETIRHAGTESLFVHVLFRPAGSFGSRQK